MMVASVAEQKAEKQLVSQMGTRAVRPPSIVNVPCTRPQMSVLASKARFNYVFGPRRFGKTSLASIKVIKKVSTPNPLGLVWWIAPTYKQCQRPFRHLLNAFWKSGLLLSYSKAEMVIVLVTGWRIEFRTANQPDNLRGEGVDLLVIDEMGQIAEEVWNECLRPTLADTNGEFFGIGSARGRRGFGYMGYRRGIAEGQDYDPEYQGFRFTAHDACFVPRKELDEARKVMSKRAFDQEFMTVFLDGVGVVFELIRSRGRSKPVPGEPVGIGVDWAKKVDYTWFSAVGAKSGCIMKIQRLPQRLPYPKQVEALCEFVKAVQASGHPVRRVKHDQTGVGEGVDDIIRPTSIGRITEGVVFSNVSKRELVESMVVSLESDRMSFPDYVGTDSEMAYEMAMRECEDYSITIGKTGKVVYGAPEGLHDDAPTSLMLADDARVTAVTKHAMTVHSHRLFGTGSGGQVGRLFQ